MKKRRRGIYERYVKRALDVIISGSALIILSPLYVLLCILVRQKLGSPVFFCQERPGRYGKIFKMYKFRTMTDAKDKKGNLLPDKDRQTGFGQMLRRTSLDELPELYNIFKGDMSLIGPRPIVPDEIENYNKAEAKKFLSLRPGLTGYWAVNGRSCTTYKKRKQLELYYVGHCSIWLDIKIIFSTIVKVIKRDGAV